MHAYIPSLNFQPAVQGGSPSPNAMYAAALRGGPQPGMAPPMGAPAPGGMPPLGMGAPSPMLPAPQAPMGAPGMQARFGNPMMGAGLAASPMRATLQPAGYGNAVQRPFGGGGGGY